MNDPVGWISLDRAAALLDYKPSALRRTLERRAEVAADGVVEASFDGVRARKFANRWRVKLGSEWAEAGDGTPGPADRHGNAKPATATTIARRK